MIGEYDGTQPTLTGFTKSMHDGFESNLVGALLNLDKGESVSNLYIDDVKSDWEEGDMSDAAYNLNFLCDMVGINYADWASTVTDVYINNGFSKLTDKEQITKAIGSTSVGAFLTTLAFESLPIEAEPEYGSTMIDLNLQGKHGINLNLRVEGEVHIWHTDDEDEETELFYKLRFEADITPPTL